MRPLSIGLLAWIAASPLAGQTYTISTFAGGGLPVNIPGTSAALGQVESLAVDVAGNVYFPVSQSVLRWDAATGLLTAVAGTGVAGFSGDNGLAVNAQLNSPLGVAVDSSGNLYIADSFNNRVRKVASGVITTVAGNGIAGFSGDTGPAIRAELNQPGRLAVDTTGSLYIADSFNNRIRKVANGTITTIAGNGMAGFSGDGGPAAAAELNLPAGVAVDSAGNVAIADTDNNRIRKVTAGLITTVAAGLSNPIAVALDSAGNLYIADVGSSVVQEITNGAITVVAGTGVAGFSGDNGPATAAELDFPEGVAVDSAGNLYISDFDNRRIRKVAHGIITTVAGGGSSVGDNGLATGATIYPFGLALDSANHLFIADEDDNRIREVSNGVITTVAGNGMLGANGNGGPAAGAELYLPCSVAPVSPGFFYIGDDSAIRVVTNGVIEAAGVATHCPSGLAIDSAGNLYISDTENNRILEMTGGKITTIAGNGLPGYIGDGIPAASAEVNYALGIAVDPAGNLYIADTGNNRIRKVTAGVIATVAGNGTKGFSGDDGPALSAQLNQPEGVALDSAGNLYIADTYNNRVRKVTDGVITTIAGNGTAGFTGDGGPAAGAQLNSPSGIAVDSSGNVYFADILNERVRLLAPLRASLTLTMTHAGAFDAGQQGAAYTVTVSNAGLPGPSFGTVSVTDTPYPGLTVVSMSGAGWSCSGSVCARSDVLDPGSSYPAITVTVDVAANAPSPVTNEVTVTGGGSPPSSASESDNLAGGCSISLSPASATLPATGTSTIETCPGNSGPLCGVLPETPLFFTVTTNAACGAWTATSSNPDLLPITSAPSGPGPGAVGFALLNNPLNVEQGYTITVTSGAASAAYLVTQLGSQDSLTVREIDALYEQILGRDPDEAGLAFWTGFTSEGLGQMTDSFLTSPEAFNIDFAVLAAYQAAIGSPPTYAQFTAAVTRVRAGTASIGGLFQALISSGYTAATLYQNLLNRPPTASESSFANLNGLAAWFEQLIGYPSATTPVSAPENEFQSTGTYHTAADHTNALYVRMLYYLILGRDPDTSGLAFWLGIANSGGPGLLFQGSAGYPTRIQILGTGAPGEGFTAGSEFQGLFAN